MHIKAARRAGNVTVAKFIDALDVFPANASRRHRIVRRLGLGAIQCEQRRCDVISIGWLGKIVDRANLHGLDRGRDIAVTGENDMASDRRCFNAEIIFKPLPSLSLISTTAKSGARFSI